MTKHSAASAVVTNGLEEGDFMRSLLGVTTDAYGFFSIPGGMHRKREIVPMMPQKCKVGVGSCGSPDTSEDGPVGRSLFPGKIRRPATTFPGLMSSYIHDPQSTDP
jgi:hypothetical protein